MIFNAERFRKLIDAFERNTTITYTGRLWGLRNECGTQGCIYGIYAMTHPEENPPMEWISGPNEDYMAMTAPSLGFESIGAHFGISTDEAISLFGIRDDDGRKDLRMKELKEFYDQKVGTPCQI